jgi:hypothetical protein
VENHQKERGMQHHVIVKFNDTVKDKIAMADEIGNLFKGMVGTVPGVHKVSPHKNCIDMENRYDLMVIVDMDKEALQPYTDSSIHDKWINGYARYLASKVIMDYED